VNDPGHHKKLSCFAAYSREEGRQVRYVQDDLNSQVQNC